MSKITRYWFFGLLWIVLNTISPFVYATETVRLEPSANKGKALIQQIEVKNPGTDLWREIRQRNASFKGLSQVKNAKAGTLIDTKGDQWRKLRREWLLPYGGYFMVGVTGLLVLLQPLVKKRKITEGRSGKTIKRMSTMQLISHWFMAALIGFMSLTGLLLLFGRFTFIPLMGNGIFSPIASASKEGHNLMGPLVILSLVFMFIYFIRHNWPAKGDLKWLVSAGGLFSKNHFKVGFFNAGEKLLFWLTMMLGIALSVTGLLLLFPYYELTINQIQLALLIHAIAALVLIALAFAHIWMVITVEGTIDAMKDGNVDENWAKSHHAHWFEETTQSKTPETKSPDLKSVSSDSTSKKELTHDSKLY